MPFGDYIIEENSFDAGGFGAVHLCIRKSDRRRLVVKKAHEITARIGYNEAEQVRKDNASTIVSVSHY